LAAPASRSKRRADAAPAGMDKQRLLTGLVLGAVGAAVVLSFNTLVLALVLGVVTLRAAWEWTMLAGIASTAVRVLYLLVTAFAAINLLPVLVVPGLAEWRLPLLAAGAAWWLWEAWRLGEPVQPVGGADRMMQQLRGLILLIPFWFGALYLHRFDPRSPALLFFLFATIVTADSAAYFVGSRFGRIRLAPHLSPGKTVEGAVGALVAVVILALIAGTLYWGYSGLQLLAWVALAALTMAFSVVGDLTESRAKRAAGVKDSGTLLPGHGGVLDRLDGYLAATPVFALGWSLLLGGAAG